MTSTIQVVIAQAEGTTGKKQIGLLKWHMYTMRGRYPRKKPNY